MSRLGLLFDNIYIYTAVNTALPICQIHSPHRFHFQTPDYVSSSYYASNPNAKNVEMRAETPCIHPAKYEPDTTVATYGEGSVNDFINLGHSVLYLPEERTVSVMEQTLSVAKAHWLTGMPLDQKGQPLNVNGFVLEEEFVGEQWRKVFESEELPECKKENLVRKMAEQQQSSEDVVCNPRTAGRSPGCGSGSCLAGLGIFAGMVREHQERKTRDNVWERCTERFLRLVKDKFYDSRGFTERIK